MTNKTKQNLYFIAKPHLKRKYKCLHCTLKVIVKYGYIHYMAMREYKKRMISCNVAIKIVNVLYGIHSIFCDKLQAITSQDAFQQ